MSRTIDATSIDESLKPATIESLPVAAWHWDDNDMLVVDGDDTFVRGSTAWWTFTEDPRTIAPPWWITHPNDDPPKFDVPTA